MIFADLILGNGIHLVGFWTYDQKARPITVADLTCARTSAPMGQRVYRGHVRSEFVVTLAAILNRSEVEALAATDEPEPLPFDLFASAA